MNFNIHILNLGQSRSVLHPNHRLDRVMKKNNDDDVLLYICYLSQKKKKLLCSLMYQTNIRNVEQD